MKFLIEAFVHGYHRHRLQKDNTWKHTEYNPKEEPKANDVLVDELHEAGMLIG